MPQQLVESSHQLRLHHICIKERPTTALKLVLVHHDAEEKFFDSSFHCRSITGKLNCLRNPCALKFRMQLIIAHSITMMQNSPILRPSNKLAEFYKLQKSNISPYYLRKNALNAM
jgi:hypothetical protein